MDTRILFGVIGFIIGTVLGSFTKVIADRSLIKQGINGRSYCPKCKHILSWYDLLPVLSFLFLQGKCRYCGKKIGIEYVLVELLTGAIIALIFFKSPTQIFLSNDYFKIFLLVSNLFFKCFFIIILISVALTDLKKMIIPDKIVLPAIVISVIYQLVVTISTIAYFYYSLNQSFLGQKLLSNTSYFQIHTINIIEPLLCSVLMGLLIGGFFLLLIILTKGQGMGGGDVKLGAFLGFGLGFPNSLIAFMLSFISGSVIGLCLIFTGKKKLGQHIPFGPYLVFGSIVALIWGSEIVNWYLSFSI